MSYGRSCGVGAADGLRRQEKSQSLVDGSQDEPGCERGQTLLTARRSARIRFLWLRARRRSGARTLRVCEETGPVLASVLRAAS